MFQKDETQNIRGFPTRLYGFLWNLVSVFSKNDTAYPMETRSFLGKTCQRWRTQSAAWRAVGVRVTHQREGNLFVFRIVVWYNPIVLLFFQSNIKMHVIPQS